MARSFLSTLNAAARAAERARRAQLRESEQLARARSREERQIAKLERQAYFESRMEEVELENERLASELEELSSLLTSVLGTDPSLNLDSMLKTGRDHDPAKADG